MLMDDSKTASLYCTMLKAGMTKMTEIYQKQSRLITAGQLTISDDLQWLLYCH